jgi:hypothetical protein
MAVPPENIIFRTKKQFCHVQQIISKNPINSYRDSLKDSATTPSHEHMNCCNACESLLTMTMTRAGIRSSAVKILRQHIEKAHLKLKNSLTLNGEDLN